MTERTQEDIVKNIIEVMEQYVAPNVAQHGGEVNFVSFETGVVTSRTEWCMLWMRCKRHDTQARHRTNDDKHDTRSTRRRRN